MESFKIGDRVKNISGGGWNSCVCESNSDYAVLGIEGIIMATGYSSGAGEQAYAIRWDNGKMCGKSHHQIELICSSVYEIY